MLNRLLACLIVSAVCGCASLPQDVPLLIQSSPDGATVTSSEGWTCETPCDHRVARGSSFDLEFELSGYDSRTSHVTVRNLRHSKVGTYVGLALGAVTGAAAADFGSALGEGIGRAIVSVFTSKGSDEDIKGASSGEQVRGALLGAAVYGAIGFGIDRWTDHVRSKAPKVVSVTLQQSSDAQDEPSEANSK